jgi:ABC-type antimicrobial peptide transport system permease subunit
MLPVVLGLVVGIALAVGLGRGLRSMLSEVTPADPVTLSSVVFVLLGVGLVASFVPARRAMRVDPIVALRYE